LVALDNIAAGWPEEIRQEIAGLQIPHVKCAFPSAEICNGLMAGKMQFKWAQLRARIHPALLNLEPSDHGETLLELPLNIITPLFLEFIRSTSGDQRPIDAEQTTAFFRKARETTKFYRKKPAPVPPVPAPAATAPKAAEPKAAAKPQSTTSFRKKSHTTQFVKAATGPGTGGTLTLSLSLVSSSWPPLVLKEIQQHNLSEAKIEMPLDAVEPGLKRGKIEFPWKQIYSWLKPPPPEALKSPLGATPLALPLSVVAPLYLQQRQPPTQQKLASALASIPDVFSSTKPKPAADAPAVPTTPDVPAAPPPAAPPPVAPPPAAPPPAVTAPPVPAQAEVQSLVSMAPQMAAPKCPQNIAELFGAPQKKNWTPKEIVHKTVELPGVQGALIVLQDGLLVASCMPPGRKTETIAAFLPQIMGRMSQYAKEFTMGELECVALTVGEGTMRIYNAGIIYFAALGRPDGELPIASLKLIANELSRHTR